ncbi:MAG: hypothetical protein QGI15_02165 [Candidatus Scalindua sp.]|nr:hypothetical protein [Candidatus Scalindua sp.]
MFGKDKESKEFFEVFKKPEKQEGANYSIKEFQKKQENPNVIPKPVPERKPEDTDDDRKKEKLDWITDTKSNDQPQSQTVRKKPGKLFFNEVILKQETVIFGALGAVFLSLVCFFVGYKIGHRNELEPEVLQKAVVYPELGGGVKIVPQNMEVKAVDLSLPQVPVTIVKQEPEPVVNKWTLQIISYSNTKKHLKQAANLAKAIKDWTGYKTFVAKRGKEIVVCVGRFNLKDSSELREALKEISKLEYEGKRQFASSYAIQIKK